MQECVLITYLGLPGSRARGPDAAWSRMDKTLPSCSLGSSGERQTIKAKYSKSEVYSRKKRVYGDCFENCKVLCVSALSGKRLSGLLCLLCGRYRGDECTPVDNPKSQKVLQVPSHFRWKQQAWVQVHLLR